MFYSVLLPVFYRRKRLIYLLLITVVFILIYPVIQHIAFSSLIEVFHWNFKKVHVQSWFFAESYTLTILYTGLAYLAKFTTSWIMDQQIKTELINKSQASELALLRSQINPHFLFNTLNNIYSLVYSKSEKAPAAMTKLSDIMRYTLYEANTDKVLLSKEVDYLKSYIELLQLRINKENFIRFDVDGPLENKTIPPMLLIPFVENAFKHCNKKSKAPGIKINLEATNKLLNFKVINTIKNDIETQENEQGGMGLKNVTRRLELLYHERYKLSINKTHEFYTAELNIEIQ